MLRRWTLKPSLHILRPEFCLSHHDTACDKCHRDEGSWRCDFNFRQAGSIGEESVSWAALRGLENNRDRQYSVSMKVADNSRQSLYVRSYGRNTLGMFFYGLGYCWLIWSLWLNLWSFYCFILAYIIFLCSCTCKSTNTTVAVIRWPNDSFSLSKYCNTSMIMYYSIFIYTSNNLTSSHLKHLSQCLVLTGPCWPWNVKRVEKN